MLTYYKKALILSSKKNKIIHREFNWRVGPLSALQSGEPIWGLQTKEPFCHAPCNR